MIFLLAIVAAGVLVAAVAVLVRVLVVLDRIEAAARLVAVDLAVAQTAVDGVASDLADSHDRADEVDGPDGAAADAASRSTTKKE